MDNPILSALESAAADGYHPTAVHAESETPGQWQVRISLHDYVSLGEGGDLPGGYKVSIDRRDMPQGVNVSGLDKVEDIVLSVKASSEGMEAMIKEVAKAGEAIDVAHGKCTAGLYREYYLTKPNRWRR